MLFPLLGIGQPVRNITFNLQSEKNLSVPLSFEKKFFLVEGNNIISSYFDPKAKCLTFEKSGQDTLVLPFHLDLIISEDGKTILQFGDPLTGFHPTKTDLIWLNDQGEVTAKVENHYRNQAVVKMSSDGYVSVAGELMFSNENVLKVYSPQGDELWSRPLEKGRRVAEMITGNTGVRIGLITTDSERWLEGHQLEIISDNGRDIKIVAGNGILQKMGFTGSDENIFVQGYDRYFLTEAITGQVKWMRNEKIRMVSPSGLEVGNNNQNIYLATVDWKGKPTGEYTWIIRTLNYNNGEDTGRFTLPGRHSSTWNKVFKKINPTQVTIETINKEFELKIN